MGAVASRWMVTLWLALPPALLAEQVKETPAVSLVMACGSQPLVLAIADADAFELDASVEVVSGWEDTHWGTRLMTVRDPDGREWKLQAPK